VLLRLPIIKRRFIMVDYVHNYGGKGKVSQDFGIKESKTASTTIIGDQKDLAFGRQVTFCKAGAVAIAKGVCVQGPASVANHVAIPVSVTASIGETTVTVCAGATAITRDQYKDGLLVVTCGTGTANSYMIQGHASAASGSGVEIELKDGIEVALNTASIVDLIANRCNGAVIVPADGATSNVIGVALSSAVISGYFWAGNRGPWPALSGAVASTPGVAQTGGSAAGTVGDINSATVTRPILGTCVSSAAAGGGAYTLIDFKL
jgi:hypothetical protein